MAFIWKNSDHFYCFCKFFGFSVAQLLIKMERPEFDFEQHEWKVSGNENESYINAFNVMMCGNFERKKETKTYFLAG